MINHDIVMKKQTLALLILSLLGLAGCGQTGPLYLPGEQQPVAEPAEQRDPLISGNTDIEAAAQQSSSESTSTEQE